MRIFSSKEYCLLIAQLMFRQASRHGFYWPVLVPTLISYDEPETLSYQIIRFEPISAYGRRRTNKGTH